MLLTLNVKAMKSSAMRLKDALDQIESLEDDWRETLTDEEDKRIQDEKMRVFNAALGEMEFLQEQTPALKLRRDEIARGG